MSSLQAAPGPQPDLVAADVVDAGPAPPFTYREAALPDPSSHIRLLDLQPESEGQELKSHLRMVPLASAPAFTALSYTWGPSPPAGAEQPFLATSTTSQSRHARLTITASLEEALRHLRHPTDTLTLWVDQICINQSDPAEKTAQVALMGTVYAAAAHVLVWLGPAGDGSDEMMDAWAEIGQAAMDWGLDTYYTVERYPLLRRLAAGDPPPELVPAADALRALCGRAAFRFLGKAGPGDPDDLAVLRAMKEWYLRPWFTRVWVVQEFALAASDPIFVCGTKLLPAWLAFQARQVLHLPPALEVLYERPTPPYERLRALDDIYANPTVPFFTARRRREKLLLRGPDEPGAGDTLLDLVTRLYVSDGGDRLVFEATDPRDRIYGLLGLATDAAALGITPDYSPTVTAGLAYARATRAIIWQQSLGQQQQEAAAAAGGGEYALDILSLAQFPKRVSGGTQIHPGAAAAAVTVPSWVPDFVSMRPSFCARLTSTLAPQPLFHAAGTIRAARLLPTADECVLGLAGYIVDEILEAGEPFLGQDDTIRDTGGFDSSGYLDFFAEVRRLCDVAAQIVAELQTDPVYLTPERRAEAAWRVTVGDVEETSDRTPRRATEVSALAHGQLAARCEAFERGLTVVEAAAHYAERDGEDFAAERIYEARVQQMRSRRPFVTNEGYIGMGPLGVEAGDVVVVFEGAQVPHVLRRHGSEANGFVFLGEAFCDGIMDGIVPETHESEAFYLH